MSLKSDAILIGVAGLAVVGLVLYARYKVIPAVGDALEAVNPLNNDNVINQAATGFYQSVTGSTGSIGTDLYDWFHAPATPSTTGPGAVAGSGPIVGYYSNLGLEAPAGAVFTDWLN